MTRLGPQRLLVWQTQPMPGLCRTVFEAGGVCTCCPYLPRPPDDDGRDWAVLLSRRPGEPVALAPRTGLGGEAPTIVRVGQYRGSQPLTSRQERAIAVAFEMGYFSYPRRADLAEVARALSISRSTAMEILRRGLMKLVAQRARAPVAVRGMA